MRKETVGLYEEWEVYLSKLMFIFFTIRIEMLDLIRKTIVHKFM